MSLGEADLELMVRALEQRYHRVVFVVAPHGAGLTGALATLAQRLAVPVLALGATLSEALLDMTTAERRLRTSRALGDIVAATGSDPVIIDSIEVLFDVSLALDPIAALSHISRHRTLVVAWPGTWDGRRIAYAEAGHPEHKLYDADQVMVLPLAELRSLLATPSSLPS